jgi:hypothetical protein
MLMFLDVNISFEFWNQALSFGQWKYLRHSSAGSKPARRKRIRRGFKSRPAKNTNTSGHHVIQDIPAKLTPEAEPQKLVSGF